jgi:hypothetical protein
MGGRWAGTSAGGPEYWIRCKQCDEPLNGFTFTNAPKETFIFEFGGQFIGERFVAIMTPDGDMKNFLRRVDTFVQHLKSKGFDARCPGYTFAGILVPKTEAMAARDYLKSQQIDYLQVWVSDDSGRELNYIGCTIK